MKTFYIQIDSENIIRDIVEMPVDGYIEVQLQTPLPFGINGGWFKWENDTYEEYPELKPVDATEQRIVDLEMAVAAILGGV
jgi:hypothetical protein